MVEPVTIAVVSDIHYACKAEQARGDDYELAAVKNPLLRPFLRLYRNHIWLRHPLRHNQLLDAFLERNRSADWIVANGDYSCDSAFVGLNDAASCQSAKEAFGKLRAQFGSRCLATLGDHEFGKFSFVGRNGGMRLASFHCAVEELGIAPFWSHEIGRYTLIGVTSSLAAFPLLEAEALPSERDEWLRLRTKHLEEIKTAFSGLASDRRVILFCHDPTALPFLWNQEPVRRKLDQVELTMIGHLHSPLIFWKSRLLSGMPEIRFLGHSIRKMSRALSEAKYWKPFKPRLCPSLAGVELLKDGGFLTLELDPEAEKPVKLERHSLPR